ncbi:hypothetical protein PpBr36_04789 [Pyricularia pennisetigena]|uniref:hypothetical protein n=1 Tax=Pyricularia pennisetigena TaxID=1578925 RepID=UPI001152365F|nr:hypothetical protein PpBr36_04789 [Pyricularia pennisetigena]TLS26127.1 hypothetical protein PpBr36_04789 [Pyricularia pennisetigena]
MPIFAYLVRVALWLLAILHAGSAESHSVAKALGREMHLFKLVKGRHVGSVIPVLDQKVDRVVLPLHERVVIIVVILLHPAHEVPALGEGPLEASLERLQHLGPLAIFEPEVDGVRVVRHGCEVVQRGGVYPLLIRIVLPPQRAELVRLGLVRHRDEYAAVQLIRSLLWEDSVGAGGHLIVLMHRQGPPRSIPKPPWATPNVA